MDNQWTIPHTDPQHHHVIPPTAGHPDLNFQQNAPAPTQDTNATVPNCSCQRCSDAQYGQPTWNSIEQRDPQYFGNAVAPYVNRDQGDDNHVETALIAPVRERTQFVPSQTAGIQDNFGYAPVPERAGPPNVGLLHASILDASIVEGRRRLAGHYLNNPDSYVSMIRLEPGPSGQSQVIIVLEMANIP
ncbi:hypothetical protein BJY52DRAFT_1420050 [Lactarius psammicola]|nr:hypothetical protein BJY52DRAFT_1420050 [Lactarius psammicola]